MGYYTNYTLMFEADFETTGDIRSQITYNGDMDCAVGLGSEPCKWYNYKEDMIAFSKRFPDILFELTGYGEESEDIWIAWFKNGSYYRENAKIIMPVFEEVKLGKDD